MRTVALPGAAILAAFLAGAMGCMPKAIPRGYNGPTESMASVIERVNCNSRAIPTLYARCYVEATIVDRQNKSRFINTDGDMFVRKPHELLLRGRKDLAGKVFELGSTADRYWLTIYLDENTRWWGYHQTGPPPENPDLPVRPDLLGHVLAISQINTDFLADPVPTMTFNNDLDVYMVAWHTRLPDRWCTEKEIWYDRATLQPRKVLLFDRNGRVVLRANLSQHSPVAVPTMPESLQPIMPSRFDLYFPESGSLLMLKLTDMCLVNRAGHPREGTIVFREDPSLREIRVDEKPGS